MHQFYKPSGDLQGDSKPMPDRGTGTGMTPNQQLGGMSTDQNATNRLGSMGGAAKSDPAMKNMPCKADR